MRLWFACTVDVFVFVWFMLTVELIFRSRRGSRIYMPSTGCYAVVSTATSRFRCMFDACLTFSIIGSFSSRLVLMICAVHHTLLKEYYWSLLTEQQTDRFGVCLLQRGLSLRIWSLQSHGTATAVADLLQSKQTLGQLMCRSIPGSMPDPVRIRIPSDNSPEKIRWKPFESGEREVKAYKIIYYCRWRSYIWFLVCCVYSIGLSPRSEKEWKETPSVGVVSIFKFHSLSHWRRSLIIENHRMCLMP